MNASEFPNDGYSAVVINGSWNNWGVLGLSLNDDNKEGIWGRFYRC
jgi:hypothetical protein